MSAIADVTAREILDRTDFAREVIRLYSDAELWETLSRNVQGAIEQQCAPSVAAARFEELFRLLNVW